MKKCQPRRVAQQGENSDSQWFCNHISAYDCFLEHNGLIDEISRMRRHLDFHDPFAVSNVSREIQDLIALAPSPADLEQTILSSYARMTERIQEASHKQHEDIGVALRSSAIGEDRQLSCGGQYLTVLNVPQQKPIDTVSDEQGPGSVRLGAPIPLDLHIIDLGGGLTAVSSFSKRVTAEQIVSPPLKAVLDGMLHKERRNQGPKPIDLDGFLSVVREQVALPVSAALFAAPKNFPTNKM